MNPEVVRPLLAGLVDDVAISEARKDSFTRSPEVVAFQREIIRELEGAWDGILEAKTWEELIEQRSNYKTLVRIFELPSRLTATKNVEEATPDDVVEQTGKNIQGIWSLWTRITQSKSKSKAETA